MNILLPSTITFIDETNTVVTGTLSSTTTATDQRTTTSRTLNPVTLSSR
jgi:hypothetical protein